MNGETITLTPKAHNRVVVLNALDRRELRMREAAEVLRLSVRQVRRLRRGYRQRGPRALVHGNRGRPSPRRIAEAVRDRLVRLARTTYARVNYQHLSELLAEHEQLTVSRPTLYRILREAGVRSPRTRRPPKHRRRRDRMPQPGLLVQLDGSHHAWLEDRGPRLVLLVAVDDATGEVLGGVFRDREDTHGYLLLLQQISQRRGLPVAVYTDRHGIFQRQPRTRATLDEQLRGHLDLTQVGRVLHELGIQWVPASSPQAKGRIERLFEALQDRLISELRLAHIRDRVGANAFLPQFWHRYNARFRHSPAEATSAYRPWPSGWDPQRIFCFKYVRTVANDNTVALPPHRLQVLPGPGGRSYAKARVEVHERLDGSLAVVYQGRLLPVESPPQPRQAPEVILARHLQRVGSLRPSRPSQPPRPRRNVKASTSRPWKPGPDHPWNQYAVENKKRKLLRKLGVTFSLNG